MKKEYDVGIYVTDEIKKDINKLTEEEMELYKEFRRTLQEQEDKNSKKKEMSHQIMNKLGFDIDEYNSDDIKEAYEKDNIPNPFEELTLEELLYLRENDYLLKPFLPGREKEGPFFTIFLNTPCPPKDARR